MAKARPEDFLAAERAVDEFQMLQNDGIDKLVQLTEDFLRYGQRSRGPVKAASDILVEVVDTKAKLNATVQSIAEKLHLSADLVVATSTEAADIVGRGLPGYDLR